MNFWSLPFVYFCTGFLLCFFFNNKKIQQKMLILFSYLLFLIFLGTQKLQLFCLWGAGVIRINKLGLTFNCVFWSFSGCLLRV